MFFFLIVVIQLTVLNVYSADSGKDYIIKLTNDTVYGKIESQSDIDFRTSLLFYDNEGKMTTYSPNEILAFYIDEDNRFFESKKVLLNGTYYVFFLRCLVKGEVSLYLLREKEEEESRFYYEKEEKFIELSNMYVFKPICTV